VNFNPDTVESTRYLTKGYACMKRYDEAEAGSTEKIDTLQELKDLDEIARQGALRMLKDVLEAEVEEFLGRRRYERSEEYRGFRNGFGKKRKVAVGCGTMELRAPSYNSTMRADRIGLPRNGRLTLYEIKTIKMWAKITYGETGLTDQQLLHLPDIERSDYFLPAGENSGIIYIEVKYIYYRYW
jgi:hypothetical protein